MPETLSSSLTLLSDVDEVMLDYVTGFAEWCRDQGLPVTGRPDDWNMAPWLGVSREECRRLIVEFSLSPAFAELPAMPGAVDAVECLHDAGYLFVLVTSCGDDPKTVARRRDNLERLFGKRFAAMHVLPLGADKTSILKSYRPTIYMEDNVPHALAARSLGHTVFVQRNTLNRRLETPQSYEAGLFWMNDMTDVINHVAATTPAVRW